MIIKGPVTGPLFSKPPHDTYILSSTPTILKISKTIHSYQNNLVGEKSTLGFQRCPKGHVWWLEKSLKELDPSIFGGGIRNEFLPSTMENRCEP